MRLFIALFAVMLMAVPQANATDKRITISEIHSFIHTANASLNHYDLRVNRDFMEKHVSDNAIFTHNMSVYQPAHPYANVYHNNPAYSAYYRYPLNPYFSASGSMTFSKWQEQRYFEDKKRVIAGYSTDWSATNVNMRPYANMAVVDLDMREYSIGYAPYNPNLTSRVLHANSRCKMYLGRTPSDALHITRMDCNTNTNLPI